MPVQTAGKPHCQRTLGGVMPNPREALTKAEPFRSRGLTLAEAEENAPPQITAHTQPYMLTIRAGGRSTWKQGGQESKKRITPGG